MSKSFDFKPLSAAVIIALGGGLTAMQLARADATFSPYFDTTGNRDTFVSLVTNADGTNGKVPVHWVYSYKVDPTNPSEACLHADAYGQMTKNDLGTFDLAAAATYPSSDKNSTGFYIDPGYAGTLLFNDNDTTTAPTNGTPTLRGEVIWFDADTGTVGSYRMVNNPTSANSGEFAAVGYGNAASVIATGTNTTRAIFNPMAIWHPGLTTEWNLAVTATGMEDVGQLPRLASQVYFAGRNADGTPHAQHYYDRNEVEHSTSGGTQISCYATVTLSDFIDVASLTSAQAAGGWAYFDQTDVKVQGQSAALDVGILVFKDEAAGATSVTTSENEVDY